MVVINQQCLPHDGVLPAQGDDIVGEETPREEVTVSLLARHRKHAMSENRKNSY